MKRESPNVAAPRAERRPWSSAWTAEGVIAVLEPLVLEPRRRRMLEVGAARLDSVTVVLDAPHDPHNGAAVLRSCDAFGVQRLHVVPRLEPFLVSGAVAKGTQGWVDIELHESAEAAVEVLRAGRYELVKSHPEGELCPEDLPGIDRLALVLGNERDGVGEILARAASRSVRVPMRGYVESLNVSVSAAILLAAATRGRPGDLPEAERRDLYARGLYRTVPRAGQVLGASAPR